MTQDDLLIKLFDEVEYIWPKTGYPPLVTPYSQYVKNLALMNVVQMVKGKERFSLIDDNTWDMLLGKQGNVPVKSPQNWWNWPKRMAVRFTQAIRKTSIRMSWIPLRKR